MNKCFLGVLIYSSVSFAEPFYGEASINGNLDENNESLIVKNSESLTACSQPSLEKIRYVPLKLSQLKFIGVLEKDNKYKAIFMTPEKQIFDLQINDWLSDEQIQIVEISLSAIKYIDWQYEKNCNSPAKIILKL
ncbi:pilus assembly protein PilP [Actinobacillus vicugnae]|uniref:pilus assembly protein PilP n=1 Tax=Actinobacillus vicugnae TaxID=2573093 RepID=UPI0012404246|nr:pilus assembly protein PilP [Actinobacillus vicugnae]